MSNVAEIPKLGATPRKGSKDLPWVYVEAVVLAGDELSFRHAYVEAEDEGAAYAAGAKLLGKSPLAAENGNDYVIPLSWADWPDS